MKILTVIIMFIQISTTIDDQRVITTLKYSRYRVKPLIVNGTVATIGQVPFLVSLKEPRRPSLYLKGQSVWTNLCGGSIISKNKVLTAAHCFEQNNYYYQRNPSTLRIIAGNLATNLVHSGRTETSDEGQWRSIVSLKVHDQFQFPFHDIALAIVNSDFVFSSAVSPIAPAIRVTDYAPKCYSAGYGSTGVDNKVTDKLLIAPIIPMTRMKCSFVWQMNMNNFICTHSLVADVAQGDSGGPLACSDTLDNSEPANKDVLAGVVSGKNYDKTTLYTRVAAYSDWIKRGSSTQPQLSSFLCLITLLILIYLLFHWFSFNWSEIMNVFERKTGYYSM